MRILEKEEEGRLDELFADFLTLSCEQGVKEMLSFFTKTFTSRTPSATRQTIQHESYLIHVHNRGDGICGVAVTDGEYPPRVAFAAIGECMISFVNDNPNWGGIKNQIEYEPINANLQKFQDPKNGDKITKIQSDLDETQQILHKTIDNVLERGVKLDQLVERSDDLSRQSKMFYKQARKTNSCCSIC